MPKPKKEKQDDLPGMEERKIPDLHKAALNYVEIRDERMELTKEEVTRKSKVLALMKKHKRDSYLCDGVEITIIHEEETVKVKVKDKDSESAGEKRETVEA